MQQLTQKLNKGEIEIREVPMPTLAPGQVLVRNHFSLISAGTEGNTVKTARKSLIGKAKERPQQVKQVLDVLRTQGIVQTYRAVMKKLDAYSPLGYSCSGEVMDVGEGDSEFQIGDLVACAGVTASHAEVVSVPINLCVKLPANSSIKDAAYNTLGAIAMQGVRQADLRLGESCAVIGLGLLGQLTCLMLRSSGVNVYGIDVDDAAVQAAKEHCADDAWTRETSGIADQIGHRTDGLGVDAVIITAGTTSLDPINFAGEIARKRGRVVVVGAVPTGFDRDPHYYRKELELRMSCSYGPGRYDLDYEEKGRDYPAAYVRWTEKRNMKAFQTLLASGRIHIDYLTSHEFPLDQASNAYDMILNRTESFLGILLKYDIERVIKREKIKTGSAKPVGKVGIGFIGAGSYAQSNLLPNLPRTGDVVRCGVLTNSGTTSKRVAEKFNFQFCASDADDIFGSGEINTVFIATRHDTHGDYVLQSIRAGKHVFVEKPVCLSIDELIEIRQAYAEANKQRPLHLMVGFNRRFSPHVTSIKKKMSDGPVAMTCRVNSGAILGDSWIQDKQIGGGRIVGEGCHFIDLMTHLCGSLPIRVRAIAVPDPNQFQDTVSVNIEFANGSIGTLHYFANGSKSLPKEHVEVYQSGRVFTIQDYRSTTTFGSGKPKLKKSASQNKGQAEMVSQFLTRIKAGGQPLIPFAEIDAVMAACFAAVESLKTGMPVGIVGDLSGT